MRKKLFILLLLLATGCRPVALWFSAPDGPPEFRLGWEDGCDTGLSAQDSGYLYRALYGYKRRIEMEDNDLYKNGWNEGFSYCRFSAASLLDD